MRVIVIQKGAERQYEDVGKVVNKDGYLRIQKAIRIEYAAAGWFGRPARYFLDYEDVAGFNVGEWTNWRSEGA